jgi:hypothetical protein
LDFLVSRLCQYSRSHFLARFVFCEVKKQIRHKFFLFMLDIVHMKMQRKTCFPSTLYSFTRNFGFAEITLGKSQINLTSSNFFMTQHRLCRHIFAFAAQKFGFSLVYS